MQKKTNKILLGANIQRKSLQSLLKQCFMISSHQAMCSNFLVKVQAILRIWFEDDRKIHHLTQESKDKRIDLEFRWSCPYIQSSLEKQSKVEEQEYSGD
jgi:hypothetical protein